MMQANQENKTMAPQGVHGPGTGLANPEVNEAQKGTGQGLETKAEDAKNESAAGATPAQPGFEAAPALLGITASFGLFCGKN
jgi:hypothetical protein